MVRTPGFHPGNRGSIPLGGTEKRAFARFFDLDFFRSFCYTQPTMRILAIESSCDDTSIFLMNVTDDTMSIISKKTASQVDIHAAYGGVVPEVAGRKHCEYIFPVVDAVMEGQAKPDVIAVTSGPGLITGLLVGMELAKTLSYLWDVPLVRMNHLEGHIYSTLIPEDNAVEQIAYPALALIVSGGHTSLVYMPKEGVYEEIGKTRDDAAGECFDKVGKLIGFEYPGGPKISQLAAKGNKTAIEFPRPMKNSGDFDFSFSGLKTAALYWLQDNGTLSEEEKADFCASFEEAIVDVLSAKTAAAAKKLSPKTVLLSGGVSANPSLRNAISERMPEGTIVRLPSRAYCTDNAGMIGAAAYRHAKDGKFTPWEELKPDPNWRITDV